MGFGINQLNDFATQVADNFNIRHRLFRRYKRDNSANIRLSGCDWLV